MTTSPSQNALLGQAPARTSNTLFGLTNDYLDHILPADNTMKVLLVDEYTLNVLSMSLSQTTLLNKGVFLVDQISVNRQRSLMKNMRCIIFIRPQITSVEAACSELRMGKYESYAIVFCGPTTPDQLDRLARADTDKLVNHVEEVFCDFSTVNSDAFLTEIYPTNALLSSYITNSQIRRMAEGLATMIVAQRRRPYIRFQRSSPFARRLASELAELLHGDPDLYNYRSRDAVLLLLDRSDDPVTALLTPWTYQAMLHEHVGLQHNTLHLPPDVKGADAEGYVFSQQDDLFFAANMYANWGELCNNVKAYVDKCKAALNLDRATATMDELRQFLQTMPQTKSLAGSVTKHATVTTHLVNVIKRRSLLELSVLEQDMIASNNLADHWARLQQFAARGDVDAHDLLRLCLIFHLRYEKAGQASRTAAILDRMSSTHTTLLRKLREYYGKDHPTDGLFTETGVMATIVKTFVDVGNIYTQHEPVLRRTLLNLYSGKLELEAYPYITSPPAFNVPGSSLQPPSFRAREAIVFMCGGYTFEEAALVHAVNVNSAFKPSEASGFLAGHGGDVVASIGGEAVLNTSSFIELLQRNP